MSENASIFPYKTILVTGATGTFGHAFVRHMLAHYSDVRLRLFSRDEVKQHAMAQLFPAPRLSFLLGDVRDVSRLHTAVAGVDLVVHAAALKRIEKGEYDGEDFHKTNVLGTLNVMKACQRAGVQQAIFLSSDKCVSAVNVYGMTKALAERLWIQGNHYAPHGTRLAAIRYGNVANSRGSVIETWHTALAAEQPLQITDERMTRFWLSIEDAVQLVIWTATHGLRGGVVVPHLPAFAMTDLAQVMGATEQTWHVIGRRPGEKLAEQLMVAGEQERAYWYADSAHTPVCYVIPPLVQSWGSSDERALWMSSPQETVCGPVPETQCVPYSSDTWWWRLSQEDLRQRLEAL